MLLLEPVKYTINVPKHEKIRFLLEKLSELCGIETGKLLLGEVYYRRARILLPTRSLQEIRENDTIEV